MQIKGQVMFWQFYPVLGGLNFTKNCSLDNLLSDTCHKYSVFQISIGKRFHKHNVVLSSI